MVLPLYFYCLLLFFCNLLFFNLLILWVHHAACRILAPQPGIKPRPSSVKAWNPNHWTARKVLYCRHLMKAFPPELFSQLYKYFFIIYGFWLSMPSVNTGLKIVLWAFHRKNRGEYRIVFAVLYYRAVLFLVCGFGELWVQWNLELYQAGFIPNI